MKSKLILILFAIFFVGFVSASMPTLGVFKQGEDIELKQTCSINATFCTNCNISSVDYPNGSRLLSDVQMTKRIGDFNYTILGVDVSELGQYRINGYCRLEPDVMKNWVYFIEVTPTGQSFDSGQGFVSLGLLAAILAIMFFFMILGFKFTENDKTKPLALLFVVIAMFLAIYSLQLGLNYSVDILEYEGLTDMQSTIYISILWLVSGISIISFILMVFGFLREFGKGKMIKNYGEGFDPISQTYQ